MHPKERWERGNSGRDGGVGEREREGRTEEERKEGEGREERGRESMGRRWEERRGVGAG